MRVSLFTNSRTVKLFFNFNRLLHCVSLTLPSSVLKCYKFRVTAQVNFSLVLKTHLDDLVGESEHYCMLST